MTEGCKSHLDFYGNSFIADHEGQVVEQAGRDQEEVLVHRFNFQKVKEFIREKMDTIEIVLQVEE